MNSSLFHETTQGFIKTRPDVLSMLPTPGIVLSSNSPVFTILETNNAFRTLLGIQEYQLTGKGFYEAFANGTSLNRNEWVDLLDSALAENTIVKIPLITYKGKAATGLITSISLMGSIAPVLDFDNKATSLICSFTDVTEVRSYRPSERDSNLKRYAKLLEETQRVAGMGSWESNLQHKSVFWSKLTREIYEVADSFEPTFENFNSFFKVHSDCENFLSLVKEAMETGQLFDTEHRIITGKGNVRWIRVTGQPEFEAGICTRIYGVVQDTTSKKSAESLLTESRNQLESLIHTVNGVIWEASAHPFTFTFVSENVRTILGYTPNEWQNHMHFWEEHLHPDDRESTVADRQMQTQLLKDHILDYRMMKADGSIIWFKDIVSVIQDAGDSPRFRGLMVDITENKIIEELNKLEKSVLEQNATNDTSLHEVVIGYLRGIEAIFPGMHCSMHKVKENRLELALAPSLPTAYFQRLYNIPIGPFVGSCGTAAYTKERVVAADIANDPRWSDYGAFALSFNLKACWSQPIINSDGIVIATLGFYYNKVRFPKESELSVIERTASILRVILESRQKSVLLEESALVMKQGQELAGFGNWQWDILNNVVKWSDVLYHIYGRDKTDFKATFEGYLELLHVGDRERVKQTLLGVFDDKNDVVFEERIIRPDGEIRHLKSWGRLQMDDEGIPTKMLGACLDITESKKNQELLIASESRLRNLVNAQTNYVMRIDLNGNYTYYNNKYFEDFRWIFDNEDLYGKDSMATVTDAHKERVLATFKKCQQNPNQVYQIELDKNAPNGGVRSTFWHFICLTNSKGKPFELQCIGLDISDKKKAEDSLRRSNERYKYVNKATNDAIYDWSSETDRVRWGEGYTRLFGLDTGDDGYYTSGDWKNRIHPSERDAVLENLATALKDVNQERWQSSYRFRNKNGNYSYVHEIGYIIRNSEGITVRMIGVLRDVTKQKQEEHHLKLLESVITHANDIVIIAEAEPIDKTSLKIVYVNEAFTRITGFEYQEVMGQNPLLFTNYDPDSTDRPKWVHAIQNGLPLQGETNAMKKNGTKTWISLSLNPVEDEKGQITHWVSIGRDISESKRYIMAIEQQNETLRNIAFMQSHVVRAPLARLMGATGLIRDYHNSEQENNQLLDYILTSAQELDTVIKAISNKSQNNPLSI
jgi:PAS domain S-box-containing protein